MTRLTLEHGAINLAQGFPDFPPAARGDRRRARGDRRRSQPVRVTWGSAAVRRAQRRKAARVLRPRVDPESHITVTCGVTEAITAALLALGHPGGEVVIIEPFHENYLPACDLRRRERGRSTPSSRRTTCSIPSTCGVPSPAGRAHPAQHAAQPERPGVHARGAPRASPAVHEHELVAVTDEIYEHILYDGRRARPLGSLPGMEERTMTLSGLGKTYAVTGWRVGWAIAARN